MERQGITASPLSWPIGWKRTKRPARAAFDRNHNVYKAVQAIYRELARMRVSDSNVIVSTNLELRLDGTPRSTTQRRAREDPGAAVYFKLKRNDKDFTVLACDRWDRVEHNLWAIAKHLDAMRGMERWGVGSREQAFAGFKAIDSGIRHWRDVLGFDHGYIVGVAEIVARYRRLAHSRHPDTGGSDDAMAELNRAKEEALKEITAFE